MYSVHKPLIPSVITYTNGVQHLTKIIQNEVFMSNLDFKILVICEASEMFHPHIGLELTFYQVNVIQISQR